MGSRRLHATTLCRAPGSLECGCRVASVALFPPLAVCAKAHVCGNGTPRPQKPDRLSRALGAPHPVCRVGGANSTAWGVGVRYEVARRSTVEAFKTMVYVRSGGVWSGALRPAQACCRGEGGAAEISEAGRDVRRSGRSFNGTRRSSLGLGRSKGLPAGAQIVLWRTCPSMG